MLPPVPPSDAETSGCTNTTQSLGAPGCPLSARSSSRRSACLAVHMHGGVAAERTVVWGGRGGLSLQARTLCRSCTIASAGRKRRNASALFLSTVTPECKKLHIEDTGNRIAELLRLPDLCRRSRRRGNHQRRLVDPVEFVSLGDSQLADPIEFVSVGALPISQSPDWRRARATRCRASRPHSTAIRRMFAE